jgi:hypothetical protein
VYNTLNDWIFGICSSSDILKTLEDTRFRKMDLFLYFGEGVGDTYSVGTDSCYNRLYYNDPLLSIISLLILSFKFNLRLNEYFQYMNVRN